VVVSQEVRGSNPSHGSNLEKWLKCWFKISASSAPPANLAKLTVHCWWEDEMARERTGHLPSYAEAKKMKLLNLHPMAVSQYSSKAVPYPLSCFFSDFSHGF